MHLQTGNAVYDFYTGGLHHFGRGQVVLFVETSFQLYKYCDFLAVLGGGYQGVDDGGVLRHTVLRHHDFTGFRIVHGFVKEVDEVLEGVIGVIEQQVFPGDVVEDGFFFVEDGEFHRLRLFRAVQ